MSDLAALKTKRTNAKRAVSNAAKAITTVVANELTATPDRKLKLENAYVDYVLVSDEFNEFAATLTDPALAVVSDRDPKSYDAEVASSFKKALKAYDDYVALKGDGSPNVSPTSPSTSVHNVFNSTMTSQGHTDKVYSFKKRDLPVFDGTLGTYAEFKKIWVDEVVPIFGDRKRTLAQALRDSLRGGALEEVSHIKLTSDTAHGDMIKALDTAFGNLSMTVLHTKEVFLKFKPVAEDDHISLVELMRKLFSAHANLQSISCSSYISNVDVMALASLLPPILKLTWADEYGELPETTKLAPFDTFILFLRKKFSSARHLAEVQSRSKAAKPGFKLKASPSTVSSHSPSCVMHPSGSHDTLSCRHFTNIDPRERSRACGVSGHCRQCLTHGHTSKQCSHKSKCSKCGKQGHHEMLCWESSKPQEGKKQGKHEQKQDSSGGSNNSVNSNAANTQPANQEFSNPCKPVTQLCSNHHTPAVQTCSTHSLPATHQCSAPCTGAHPMLAHGSARCCNFAISHVNCSYGSVPASQPKELATNSCALHEASGATLDTCIGASSKAADGAMLDTHIGTQCAGTKGAMLATPDGAPSAQLSASHPVRRCNHTRVLTNALHSASPRPATCLYQHGSFCSCIAVTDECSADCVGSAPNSDGDSGSHPSMTFSSFSVSQQPPVCLAFATQHHAGLMGIHEVRSPSHRDPIIVFCDDGSDVSFVDAATASSLGATEISRGTLDVTTLRTSGPVETRLVEFPITTVDGTVENVIAFEMDSLRNYSGPISTDTLKKIFPSIDSSSIKRPVGPVNLLLGADYLGLHPHKTLCSDGSNLFIKSGKLGTTVCGSHPLLTPSVRGSANGHYVFTHVSYQVRTDIVTGEVNSSACKVSPLLDMEDKIQSFIDSEDLGVAVNPKCGKCGCGKCALPGHRYSFKEEQELALIKSLLTHDPETRTWTAKYPWTVDPRLLPNNYASAFATLKSTERVLLSDPEWLETYSAQIREHESRGVARKLSQEELDEWEGPTFYISHLAVEQPKSKSTPVRLVFNSSQTYKGVSLNSCLAKGPDAYNASLVGMLIRWREERVAVMGDIRKMYNTVRLHIADQHCHRFLWRDCDPNKPPEVWIITRVNLGDKPSGTIAILAKNLTAEMYSFICEEAAKILTDCTYTDDIITSLKSLLHAQHITVKCDEILSMGDFRVKGWSFAGEDVPKELCDPETQVLGAHYSSIYDTIFFPAKLNFSERKRKIPTQPNLSPEEVPSAIPLNLSRRTILQQVMGIYDPLGLKSPFVLQAKLLLRKTWELKLSWDESVPESLRVLWVKFFTDMFYPIAFPRCLKPKSAVGDPELIVFSDGSSEAYGACAYVRWPLEDGTFSSRLIIAKSRIAPTRQISIPQMELCGAVLAKRLKDVVVSESRYNFSRILHLVDSETVHCQLHKTSTRFKVFEGVRIGEIQHASDGIMKEWAWIPGRSNVADLATHPCDPSTLGPDSVWQTGPPFLQLPESEWEISYTPKGSTDPLPGEKPHVFATSTTPQGNSIPEIMSKRLSRLGVIIGATSRIINMFRHKSFSGGADKHQTAASLNTAKLILIQMDQRHYWPSLTHINRVVKTYIIIEENGMYVVQPRIELKPADANSESDPLFIVSPKSLFTRRLIEHEHKGACHPGRDATAAVFRKSYYCPHAIKVIKSVVQRCFMCKRIRKVMVSQKMGPIPELRLKPSPPFAHVVLDLFGPYAVRGEVNKRTTSKAWGVIIVDLVSRATHIEAAVGYDTESFLLALRRFAAIRGWPAHIFSDPGSQLKGADQSIREMWESIKSPLVSTECAAKGTSWSFGPGNSPWYQGAAEALIKTTKKIMSVSVGSSRLSITELCTVFAESANLLNERPIGLLPSPDSLINVLTPNALLLGRSRSSNPYSYDENTNLRTRSALVTSVVDSFWKNWTTYYAPTLLHQSKWFYEGKEVQVGDIVLVADSNILRGDYRLARVTAVTRSKDGLVRRATVSYKNFRSGESVREYRGAKDTQVDRSVQSLSLIVPVSDD